MNKRYPDNLKGLPIWGLWRIESDKNGRPTKVPYSPHYNGRASTTNPRTWGTFDQAVRKYESRPDYYDGISLIISKRYELVFVDIDHCIDDNGEMNETAARITESFAGQLIEVSQSGTGIHIITRGNVPRNIKNSHSGVEIYGDKRFCALTGNVLSGGEPTKMQSAIDELFNRYKTPERTKKAAKSKAGASAHDDQWVIDHASQRGNFKALFSGDWSSVKKDGSNDTQKYESQSEADIALCRSLAFWSDCDPDQMDRIFRSSGLYRDKWERDDYREDTIRKAIDQCEETVSGFMQQKIIEELNETDTGDVMERIRTIDPYNNELYRKRDDLSLSRLFSEVFKDQARYNTTAKEWYYYDGRVWKRDTGTMVIEGYMKTFVRCLTFYYLGFDDQDYTKFIAKYGDRTKRKRLIEDARDYNCVEQMVFDQDPNLFNCQNCVIDLTTGEPLQHDPALMLSKISNVVYDPGVKSEDFDRFIHEIMMDDDQKILYLRRIFGYCLTGENTQEQCYMCYGSTTRNGKSTLLEVIGYMFGDYGMTAQPETLALKDRSSRGASEDIARLNGCRFLHMSEPPKRMKFDVALLKTLLGRDPIPARHIYERFFEFIPVFKLVINTNYLPVVTDDTLFSSERVKVISFDRHFKPEEQDRRLKEKLKRQHNISGIFNWCLDGLQMFMDDGGILLEPDAVRRATEEYRQKSDKIQNFIDDCLIPVPGENVALKDVYYAFGEWCRINGFGTDNKSNFTEDIKSKGLYSTSGTISGKTVKNVIRDHTLIIPDEFTATRNE